MLVDQGLKMARLSSSKNGGGTSLCPLFPNENPEPDGQVQGELRRLRVPIQEGVRVQALTQGDLRDRRQPGVERRGRQRRLQGLAPQGGVGGEERRGARLQMSNGHKSGTKN